MPGGPAGAGGWGWGGVCLSGGACGPGIDTALPRSAGGTAGVLTERVTRLALALGSSGATNRD